MSKQNTDLSFLVLARMAAIGFDVKLLFTKYIVDCVNHLARVRI